MVFLLIFQKIFEWNVVYCNLAALLISGIFNYLVADMLVFKSSKQVKVGSVGGGGDECDSLGA